MIFLGFRLNAHQVCPENGPIGQGTQSVADQLISPCPETFTYEIIPTETDRWYGNLMIKSDQNLSGVWLRIILDRPSMQLGVSQRHHWMKLRHISVAKRWHYLLVSVIYLKNTVFFPELVWRGHHRGQQRIFDQKQKS